MASKTMAFRKTEPGCKGVAMLTVADIAALDGCSEKTVRRAIDNGLLEVVRIGPGRRLIRIHPDAHASYRRGNA